MFPGSSWTSPILRVAAAQKNEGSSLHVHLLLMADMMFKSIELFFQELSSDGHVFGVADSPWSRQPRAPRTGTSYE